MKRPKLRNVEAFPLETEHGQMIALRDPIGISSETLVLSPDSFYLLQFFDGKHSLLELRAEYMKAFGSFLPEKQLHNIMELMNKHLYLENEHFEKHLALIKQEFLDKPYRPAAHAGLSYEAEPAKLEQQMRSFFESSTGAGWPKGSNGKAIKGLVAPHIDIRAGGACYSHAYRALAESGGADCFIILGTGHSGLADLYSTLAKDFDTPLGTAKYDKQFISKLTANYPRLTDSEILPHKSEHVIEFQLVFLKYLYQHFYGDGRTFTFVPLLCSFSHHALTDSGFQREKQIVEDFSTALKKTIDEFDGKVCLVASVDFCHVGPRYGDRTAPDKIFLEKVKSFDQNLINLIENMDAKAFCEIIAQNDDCYRVCGFSSIYTMLNVMEAQQGQLLAYEKTEVDDQQSTVTFASMAFH